MRIEICVDIEQLVYLLLVDGEVVRESKSALALFEHATRIKSMAVTANIYNERINAYKEVFSYAKKR